MRSCIGNRLLSSGEKDEAELVAHTESDSDMTAMLARAAAGIGLEWNPPPCLECSRLDDWFLGAARGLQQSSAPLPFFPEVHEEVQQLWKAPFTPQSLRHSHYPR